MKKFILFSALVPLLLTSCAALTRYKCNREYAVKKGMEDASNGQISMPSRNEGSSCEGDYSPSSFSKDYNYGFHQKKNEICQLTTIASWGRTDGEQGASNKPQKAKLTLCQDMPIAKKLESTYETEFKKSFCAPARATKLGTDQARAWATADGETAFQECGNSKSLIKTYVQAYQTTMANNCNAPDAERFGTAEAQARKSMDEGKQKLQRCVEMGKPEALSAFERSFVMTKAQLDREEALRAAQAEAQAQQARIAEFDRTVVHNNITHQYRPYPTNCAVANDRSYITVNVTNPYSDQVLIQGTWKISYYDSNLNKITEDTTVEAVLLTGNNRKSFQKLTLPRDAAYCRADYVSNSGNNFRR